MTKQEHFHIFYSIIIMLHWLDVCVLYPLSMHLCRTYMLSTASEYSGNCCSTRGIQMRNYPQTRGVRIYMQFTELFQWMAPWISTQHVNMGLAVESRFSSYPHQAEICKDPIPAWRPLSWIAYCRCGRTVLRVVPIDCST